MFEETALPITGVTVEDLNALAVTLRGHLASFSLMQLQQVRCLRTGLDGEHELGADRPHYFGGEATTIARWNGLFHRASTVHHIPNSGHLPEDDGTFSCRDGRLYVWGINNLGDWCLAEVRFRGEAGLKGHGYQRATEVHFRKLPASEVIQKTREKPGEIYRLLLQDVNDWVQEKICAAKEARDLFQEARALIERQ